MLTEAAVTARMPETCEDGPDRQTHGVVAEPHTCRPMGEVARAVDVLACYGLLEAEGMAPIPLVARLGGRVAGAAVLEWSQDGAGRRVLEVREVVVAPGYRRRATLYVVLRQLVAMAEATCRAHGGDTLVMRVFTRLPRLVDLGVAMGFAVYDRGTEWTALYRTVR